MVQRRRPRRFHAPRPNPIRHPKSYKVMCSGCGKEVIIPVPPPNDKKLLCVGCFSKSGTPKEENEQESLRSQPSLPNH